jgi:hypothetical protein
MVAAMRKGEESTVESMEVTSSSMEVAIRSSSTRRGTVLFMIRRFSFAGCG